MNKKILGSIFAAGLALGACSGDDDAPEDSSATTATPAGGDGTTTEAGGEATGGSGLDASFGTDGILATPLSTTDHDRFISVVEGPDGLVVRLGLHRRGRGPHVRRLPVQRRRDGRRDVR